MAINFKEETVRVEYVIGEDTVRESVTEELVVPDPKPDIERVLEVTAEANEVDTLIEDGGVDLTGEIEVGVLYVADIEDPEEPQQPVHFFEGIITFDNFVDIPGSEAGMHVITDVRVIRTSYDLIDERTVRVTVTIKKFVKVVEFRQVTVITEVLGLEDGIVEEELLRLNDVVGENTVKSVVKGEIDVPPQKPPIERVLRAQAEVEDNPEVTITEDAVIVEGDIDVGVVYVGDTAEGDQPVHFVEGAIDFSKVIDIPGAMVDDMSAFADVTVKRVTAEAIDEDTLKVEVVLEVFVKVTEPVQVTVVVDVESDRVEVERELLRVEEVIGENTMSETITDNINIPPTKPDVEQVLEANAMVLDIDSTVEEGGVMVEGEIEGTALYVADLEDPDAPQQPVHFVEDIIDFDNFVQVTGAEDGMNAYANVSIKRVRSSLLNQRTIELVIALRKFVKVVQFRQLEIVTDLVVVSPVTECPPSYVVYVVQPGDTLYKIAKRYNTTVDAIVEANDIPNPDQIDVGQKLCIPKGIIKPKG
ncbi:DUF3794 and LysM peptidoglycan-binding domain-containing protein [Selenihalanaerobacter shriftii]|uniref:LysM domain-containing protein n=1 Tax=Selenihalanaerobacter shriftii TaxID=142842 RepID=A0A1T4N632_9FIRM|nr:SPOCS domain-containing protein [Selenihalanaerobacter shriftii]SJZ74760.1 protein of unknown function [Selenihalanaerobacter shriftii]